MYVMQLSLNNNLILHAFNVQSIRRAKLGKIQGGLQWGSQDLTKGVAVNFYFLRDKNITF